MKFHILIYGCQMNYADSSRLKVVLENCGFSYVDNEDEADIVIFDSCSVRQKSEDKVTGSMRRIPKNKKIRITGCMAQHNLLNTNKGIKYKKGNFNPVLHSQDPILIGFEDDVDTQLYDNRDNKDSLLLINHGFNPMYKKLKLSFPNLELFFRIDDLGFMPLILKRLGYKLKGDLGMISDYCNIIPEFANQTFQSNTKTAYIPISVGCNQFCSYCIVPFTRGLERNRSFDDIMSEVKHFVDKGAEEILLIGQIVNKHPEFIKILKAILKIKQIKWLRYVSPYPTFYNDEIFALHEKEASLCPHIHMPIQSGSDKILKRMNRGYNSKVIMDFIDKVQNINRDISLTTDFIVGFPGETDGDFEQTVELIKYGKFDMMYMGIYSPRPGTYGAKKFTDDISVEIKKQRWNQLNDMLAEISIQNNQKEIGKIKDVMITAIKDSQLVGYDEKMKNIFIDYKQSLKIGDFTRVKITKAGSLRLNGEII